MPKREWSEEEHIIVLYLYRFGYEELGLSYSRISEIMGRTPDSIIMRFANILSLEKEGAGLKSGGEKVKEIFNKYKNMTKDELRKLAINYLLNMAMSKNKTEEDVLR